MDVVDEVDVLASVVAELQTALNRADRAMAEELDVGSAEDLQVLRLLADEGPMRVGDLARRRWSSIATASARLDRLDKRGLVARERTTDDRRAVLARLTPNGKRTAFNSRKQRSAALASVATSFPVEDLRKLVDALDEPEPPVAP